MRWVLVAACLAGLGVAIWARAQGPSQRQELTIRVDPGYALPLAGDTYNVVNEREWVMAPRVAVRSPKRCLGGELELLQGGSEIVTGHWSSGHARLRAGWWELTGYPGRVVRASVRATCRVGPASGLRGSTDAHIVIPRRVCSNRRLRVLDVDGDAWADGRLVRRGQVTPWAIRVRRGRVVVGAPECNGYHAILQQGRTVIGGYDPNGRGRPFSGRSVVIARADEHAGGFVPGNLALQVLPVGDRCVECPLSLPASFAVRARGRRVAIRVYAAGVYVGSFGHRYVRVRAGEQLFARCATTCRLGRSILFQPGEPFRLVPPQARRLASALRGRQRPATRLLAPERATTRVSELRRHGALQVLAVLWQRRVRTRAGEPVNFGKGSVLSDRNTVSDQQGLILWRRHPHGWQRAYARRLPGWARLDIRSADVTRDGLADVLLQQSEGSGGCGLRAVVAAVDATVRQIFHGAWCETGIEAGDGDLIARTPYGPCPFPQGSAHCYGGVRNERLRWDGLRFRRAALSVRCLRADLDPRRGCRKK